MPDPRELLGLSNTGLGAIMQGVEGGFAAAQAEKQAELERQKTLQDLFLKEQAERRMADLHPYELDSRKYANLSAQEAAKKASMDNALQEALLPGAIQTGKGKQQLELSQQHLQGLQQLGQLAVNFAPSLERMPPQQRQATMAQIAQQYPQLAQSQVFQQLMSMDPRMLPNAMKQFGTHILMSTQEYMQQAALQKQKDDAAMARVRAQEAGSDRRLREQIEAGRFKKAELNDPFALATKYGLEKAATAFTMAAEEEADPEKKAKYAELAKRFYEMHLNSRMAGAIPGQGFDFNTGQPTLRMPYGAGITGDWQQPETQPRLLDRLPKGTQDKGDGTFTLPDGTRVRPKQQ